MFFWLPPDSYRSNHYRTDYYRTDYYRYRLRALVARILLVLISLSAGKLRAASHHHTAKPFTSYHPTPGQIIPSI